MPYVDAARAAGYSHSRIIFRHMAPNVVAPYLIMLTAFIAQAILAEASLSFLGLGVTEPTAAWGLMLSGNAADFYREAPWMILFPGDRHQPRGVRVQPVRRQPARLSRSAFQGLTARGAAMTIRFATLALASALTAGAALAQAPDWPDRPVRLIVPFPAGSSTDIVSRILANKLGARLGQQVIVDNRVGASGNIGVDAVAKAAPDGYTIGIATTSTHTLAPNLNRNLPYDPIKDFRPVSMVGSTPYVLVVYPGLAAKNVAELIALAKTKPAALNYGSAGPASLAHLAGALFARMAGVSLTHVPYKSSAQSVTDIMTGRLDMQFATVAPSLAAIRAGQLRALAVSGRKRAAALPDVATVAEQGLPGYDAVLWIALVMPAATPAAIATRLNRELTDILSAADTRETLVAQGVESEPGPPEAVSERIRGDIEKWRGVIAKAGIGTQ